MPDFHRFVSPTYFGGLPITHDLINVVSGGIGAGGSSIVSPVKPPVHVNQGTYFVAFGEAATSANTNRGLKALSENTDFLDNIVHANQSIPTVTSSVVPGFPVSSVVITGDVYVGSGVPNLQSIRSGLVAVVDSDFIPITVFNGVSYDPVLVTLIHDGASNDQVGTGYFTNPTVDFTPPIPAFQTYRLAHYVRGNLKTQPDSTYTRYADGVGNAGYLWGLAKTTEYDLNALEVEVDANLLTFEQYVSDVSLTNWRDDVHDSGAGILVTRSHIFWSNRLERFLAASDDDAPQVRIANTDLKWSTPATPPGLGCFNFAEKSTITVVGTNGNIYSTLDGATWTQRVSGSGELVHYDAAINKFLSCSQATGQTYDSVDGMTWVIGGISFANARAIACNGARWVVVGLGGIISTSDNAGDTWTLRPSGTFDDLYDVLWWPSQATFVAVGESGTVRTSADGATWGGGNQTKVGTDLLFALLVGDNDDTLLTGGGNTLISTRDFNWRHLVVPAGVDVGRSMTYSPIGTIGHNVVGLLR